MLSIEEALQSILGAVTPVSTETVDLLGAQHRVLREEIFAPQDFPPFSNSAMDGYALRSSDTSQATAETPVCLKVAFELPASRWPTQEVRPGEAARIFTGAPIPPEADAVELQENARREGDKVWFSKPVPAGKSIRSQGSHLKRDEVVLPKWSVVRSGEVGLLASCGRSFVEVSRRPRVAILSCGDELVNIDQTPKPGQILESNRYNLAAQVKEAGGEPWLLPLVPDDPNALREALHEGLQADILVTSGGASVGDYDLIQPALHQLGVSIHFWKVAIKPGKPLMFGTHSSCLVFGLPGNPVSSLVTFEVFVRPTLRKLLGYKELFRPTIQARLTAPTRPTSGRTHFVRGQLSWQQEHAMFTPHPNQNSGNLLSMRQIEALGILPPGSRLLEAGESVQAMLLAPPHKTQFSHKQP